MAHCFFSGPDARPAPTTNVTQQAVGQRPGATEQEDDTLASGNTLGTGEPADAQAPMTLN
ncbi:hypothetical protein UC34_05205 [Pandoraea vervacti]|uniref:Uncharacterized protein n=1 Tax=Pandoraea vervacti TaxID=656178 RepID=A0ABN4FX41_9BURK|nr:hypothetical protein UC34_05205 [Pandoraea vervacti]